MAGRCNVGRVFADMGRIQAVTLILSLKGGCEFWDQQKHFPTQTSAERAELITRASSLIDWSQRFTGACERLLHPSVVETDERAHQLRLLKVLIAGPILAAWAVLQLSIFKLGPTAAFAWAAAAFGFGLLAPFALITTARRRFVEPITFLLAVGLIALLVAAGGGLASPLTLLSAGLAFETGWIRRTRRAVQAGVAGGLLAAFAGAAINGVLLPDAEPSAWQWILPLIYAATILVRVPRDLIGNRQPVESRPALAVEEIIRAVVLRIQKSGDVLHASGTVDELFGVAPEMLLGTGLFDRIHIADRLGWLSAVTDLREGAHARTVRLRIRVPASPGMPTDAVYRSFLCDAVAESDSDDIIAVLRDDGAAADLEQALAQERQAAEDARLARDQLLASLGHELRTPLNAIVGFSDVLANEMFGSFAHQKQREYVELIHQSGGHLLSVVNAILDVSKLQSGTYDLQTELFRFEDAAQLCIAMTLREAEAKSIAVRLDIADDVGTVQCDRRALQQVLINLLSNAVKFTPSGEVMMSARRNGEWLELTVSDTGIGISADDLKRVGKPFTKVQNDHARQVEGTGLGLSLVKGLVRLQGGCMSIESSLGAGTRVHVSLPAGGSEKRHEPEATEAAPDRANWIDEWNNDALRKTA